MARGSRFVKSSVARLLACVAISAAPASAEPSAQQQACQSKPRSLAALACSLAEQLGPAARGANVRVVELKSDREFAAQAELKDRVAGELAAALRPPEARSDAAAQGAEAPKAESGASNRRSVEVKIEKAGGVLRLNAELRRSLGLWQRALHRPQGSVAHGFAEAPLDAELRALIPPPPLVVSEVLKLKAPERGIVALACGPLSDDGAQELVLVTRSNVRVGHIAGKAFAERKRVAWSALSPIAPTPLREALGSADIQAGSLRVGLSDRRDGLALGPDLTVAARYPGRFPVTGGGCFERSGLGLRALLVSCSDSTPSAATSGPAAAQVDAVASTGVAWVARDSTTTRLVGSGLESLKAVPTGAQLALGDLDSDGNPELAYAADTLDGAQDRLTLVTLEAGKATRRFELPAPSISAIAMCRRREGAGMAPLVLASEGELWLVR